MPLKLLGKKSWNVYNQANIDRVQADEEQARQVQQRDERKRRDDEAADMLLVLRQSSQIDTLGSPSQPDCNHAHAYDHDPRLTRRLPPTRGSDGFPNPSPLPNLDSRQTRREQQSDDPLDNITNVLFRDAVGRGQHGTTPWYSSLAAPSTSPSASTSRTTNIIGKDVWGNADTGRQTRDQTRLSLSDPLLMMKRGVKQLKEVEKQRDDWRAERERDLNEVEHLARRERKKRKREGEVDESEGKWRRRYGGAREENPTLGFEDEGEQVGRRDSMRDRHRHRHGRKREEGDNHKRHSSRRVHSHRSRSPDRNSTKTSN